MQPKERDPMDAMTEQKGMSDALERGSERERLPFTLDYEIQLRLREGRAFFMR